MMLVAHYSLSKAHNFASVSHYSVSEHPSHGAAGRDFKGTGSEHMSHPEHPQFGDPPKLVSVLAPSEEQQLDCMELKTALTEHETSRPIDEVAG